MHKLIQNDAKRILEDGCKIIKDLSQHGTQNGTKTSSKNGTILDRFWDPKRPEENVAGTDRGQAPAA